MRPLHWRQKLANRITGVVALPFLLVLVPLAVIKGVIHPYQTVMGELDDWWDSVKDLLSAIRYGNEDVF